MESLIQLLAYFFLLILLGFTLQKIKLANQKLLDILNMYSINLGLPCLVLYSLIQQKIEIDLFVNLGIQTFSILIGVTILSFIILKKTVKNKKEGATWLIALLYGNVAFLGIPLITNITGDVKIAALLSSLHLIFVMFAGVLLTELYQQKRKDISIKKTILPVLKNPILWAIVVGLFINLDGIDLSDTIIYMPLTFIKDTATPIILCAIGIFVGIHLKGLRKYWKKAFIYTAVKLVLVPVFAFLILMFFDEPQDYKLPSLVQFGLSTAITPFALAIKFNYNAMLLASFIVVSTTFILITIPLLTYILS